MNRIASSLAALTVLVATASCRHADTKRAPSPSSSGSAASANGGADVTLPALLEPLAWKTLRDVGSVGVPNGCNLTAPPLEAVLPKGATRFVTTPGAASKLLLAVDEDGDGLVDRDGILDDHGKPLRALPWRRLDAPPLVAKSDQGWLAFDTEETGKSGRRVVVWHESGKLEALLAGDQLELVDATCSGSRCAVLTTFAGDSAGPGATLLVGEPKDGAASWKRVDLPGEDQGFGPFSIVQFDQTSARIALTAAGALSVSQVTGTEISPFAKITAPFGVYDVLGGSPLIAVAPGINIDAPCVQDEFKVNLLRAEGKRSEVEGQVPPSSVVSRSLEEGSIVAWLAPVSCKRLDSNTVRAFLVTKEGDPASSTMAVADAKGFALATSGSSVDLWLSTTDRLIWLKADCHPQPVPLRTAEH